MRANGEFAPAKGRQAAREERRATIVAARFVRYMNESCAGGEDWYTRATSEIRAKYGADADLFSDLLAATSPQTDVRMNVKLAEDAYDRHRRGLKQKPWIGSHGPNIARAVRGEELSGPKVRAFARALKGDPHAIVVDTWMLRAAGYGTPGRVKRPASFRIVRRAIELTAAKVAWSGLTATSVQAVIWHAYRAANWTAKKGAGDGYLPI